MILSNSCWRPAGSTVSANSFETGATGLAATLFSAAATETLVGSAAVLMAKYCPGCNAQAAMMAMSETSISVIIEP